MNKYIFAIISVFFLLMVSSYSISFQIDNYSKVQANNGLMDSPWPLFGHDARHTGRSPYSTKDNLGGILWKFETDDIISTCPVIDRNGTLYIADWDYLYAIHPNGTIKWRFDHKTIVESSPALANDGTIYFGGEDKNLYAVNPDGTLKWIFSANDYIWDPPNIGTDGTIYFTTFDKNGGFYAINPDGTEKWNYTADNYCWHSPAISDDGTIVFCSKKSIYHFYQNGTLIWKKKYEVSDLGGPSIGDDGTIYITGYPGYDPGYLFAVNPSNGSIKWQSPIKGSGGAHPSIGLDGTIYIGSRHMFAFYPNGDIKWEFIPDGDIWHSIDSDTYAISSDGTIYIGTHKDSQNCYIFALNPDGAEKWRQWISNNLVSSAPAIGADGTVYIGAHLDFAGAFYAFNGKKFYEPTIDKPVGGKVHILDRVTKIWLFGETVILGKITIEVSHPDVENITKIEYYIDNIKRHEDTSPPYQWTWRGFSFGEHTITVVAFNTTGDSRIRKMNVLKFF